MKLSARPLPMLKTPDGAPVQSFAQQQTLWMEQFSKIEAGLHISWQALQKSDSAGLGLPMDMQEAGLFPTDWQLQAAVATLKRGKAPGPNGLTHACSRQVEVCSRNNLQPSHQRQWRTGRSQRPGKGAD